MNIHLEQAQIRTDKALAALDAGFRSKSAQKDANDKLNRAFDLLRNAFSTVVWALFEGDRETADHETWTAFITSTVDPYDLPFDLHHVRDRHIAKTRELSDDIANRMAFLLETRAAVKAAPIEKVTPKKQPSEYQVKAEMTLKELIEKRKAQYLEAIELGRIFNGLPVYANTHSVINQHGTWFLRTYYYLNGKMTPLNVIIAAAEALEREKKAA
ncbi:hypothetical protein VRRI112168_02770 [Vreelandella rituensis]|uniref:Uncharacterized protein n=1 Tax=Vreelandella rituensis TaxID=2282306 RepID=A0A368UAM3_9GAMM|nr:hypothetical protein [Halomonas rituensis]RCV93666.1 hypothetical protein DU506_00485 [Halomonas rituensis]